MAVLRDIENEVELAFIGVLSVTDITTTAGTPKSWKDGSSVEVLPRVLVHCLPVPDSPADVNGDLYEAIVEIGVQTDTVSDKSGAVLKQLMGAVRDVIKNNSLVSNLNAVVGVNISFLARGISVSSGEHEVDNDEISQMSLTLTCQLTRII